MLKLSVLRERTGVARAGSILRANHYGWFDRVSRGHYALSSRGRQELAEWPDPSALDSRPTRIEWSSTDTKEPT